jgi:hypothetical protein
MAAVAGSHQSKAVIVHQFWHNADGSSELPLVAVASCKSVAASRSRKCILWSFQSFTNVPEGIEQRDAEELVPYTEFETYPRINLYADVLRIHAMHKFGGWWLDSDTIVWPGKELPSFEESELGYIGSRSPNPQRKYGLINAVLGVNAPGHPLMQVMIDRVNQISVEDRKKLEHASLQKIQEEVVMQHGYESCLLDPVVLQGNVMWWDKHEFRAMWTDPNAASSSKQWGKTVLSSWKEVQQNSVCVHLSHSRHDFTRKFLSKDNAKGPFGRLLWAVMDAKSGDNELYVDKIVRSKLLDSKGFDMFPSITAPRDRLPSSIQPAPSIETLKSKYEAF